MSHETNIDDNFDFSCIVDCYNVCQDYYGRILRRASHEDLEDAIDMHLKYIEHTVQLGELIEKYSNKMSENELSRAQSYESTLFYCDQRLNLHISKLVAKSNEQVTKASKKGLINQLSIFSMFLTILTFVLNNAKLFSIENTSFAMIMAGNVSFILMCVVMFSMIYIFLHLDDNKESWIKRVLRVIIVVGTIAILSVLIFFLTKSADANALRSVDPQIPLSISEEM